MELVYDLCERKTSEMTNILKYPIERLYGSVHVYRLGVGGFTLLLPPTNDLEWSPDNILELESSTGRENVSSP